MNKPIKVLFFMDRLRLGGIQVLAKDILLHNDRSRMTIDILNLDDGVDYPLKKDFYKPYVLSCQTSLPSIVKSKKQKKGSSYL